MIFQKLHNRRQGYAILIVMILLVIGMATLLMLNRQSTFFTKLSGFFSRNRKTQDQAQSGFDLAVHDLQVIANNSLNVNTTGIDKFTGLAQSGGNAFDQGLYVDYKNVGTARQLTPRAPTTLSKTVGDIDTKVYYFPEDPCNGTCVSDTDYNERMPKRFFVVSQATNIKTGEMFTVESRVKLRQGSMAEFAMGVSGTICLDDPAPKVNKDCQKPFPNTPYLDYSPAVYGRTHFELDPLKLRFILEGNLDPDNPQEMHVFHDLATFQYPKDSSQPLYPFTRMTQTYNGLIRAPLMKFEQGWADNQELFVEPYHSDGKTNTDYVPARDPADPLYYTQTLEPEANAHGYNLSAGKACPAANKYGVSQIDICLKFMGTQIREYPCAKKNDDFMGRIDKNVHPRPTGNGSPSFDGNYVADLRDSGNYDRYTGEHADVYTGTTSSTLLGSTNGVVYCYMSACDCNIHVKGIVDGAVTVAANNIVIEGDLQYQNQDPLLSKNTLGLIAKNNVLIPPGIPQAATSEATQETVWQNNTPNVDIDPPFDSSPGSIDTLAESYLNITNFIPQKAGSYVDRDIGNDEYGQYVYWNPTGKEYYNSPDVLDVDGFMYAGNSVKVDGIFNPEVSSDGSMSMGFVTCDDPLNNCQNYTYRNPIGDPTKDANALYDAAGSLVSLDTSGNIVTTGGTKIQPLFYVDGLNHDAMNIDWLPGHAKYTQYNSQFDEGEEVTRSLNRLLNIFGGVTSKYYYIFDQINDVNSAGNLKMGFRRKIINGDQRSSFLFPPKYPQTSNVIAEKEYQKSYQGKSTLLP